MWYILTYLFDETKHNKYKADVSNGEKMKHPIYLIFLCLVLVVVAYFFIPGAAELSDKIIVYYEDLMKFW